jgi:DNA-binding transcriptional LysR family regulator
MDLFPLQTFLAVAAAGSVNRAATDLHLSQASVSRHVQRLESELGVALFSRRDGRALQLTPAGERVLELGRRLLDDAEPRHERDQARRADGDPRVHVGARLGPPARRRRWRTPRCWSTSAPRAQRPACGRGSPTAAARRSRWPG